MKLTITQQYFMAISNTEFCQNRGRNTENRARNLLLSMVKVPMHFTFTRQYYIEI
jgi:hypothetical protein